MIEEEISCLIKSYEIRNDKIILTMGNNTKLTLDYSYNNLMDIKKRMIRQYKNSDNLLEGINKEVYELNFIKSIYTISELVLLVLLVNFKLITLLILLIVNTGFFVKKTIKIKKYNNLKKSIIENKDYYEQEEIVEKILTKEPISYDYSKEKKLVLKKTNRYWLVLLLLKYYIYKNNFFGYKIYKIF